MTAEEFLFWVWDWFLTFFASGFGFGVAVGFWQRITNLT